MNLNIEVEDWMKYSSIYRRWLVDNKLSETKARTAIEAMADMTFNYIKGYTTEEVCQLGSMSYKANCFKKQFQLFIDHKIIKKINKRWYVNPRAIFKGYDWNLNKCYEYFESGEIPSNLDQELLRKKKAMERLENNNAVPNNTLADILK
jgi:hypothetical protein